MRAAISAIVALGAVGPLVAQDAVERFREAYATAEELRLGNAHDADGLRRAYDEAFRRFLRIPLDDPGRARWITAGAFCAELAGRPDEAARLYGEALERTPDDGFALRGRLICLLDSGGAARALELAAAEAAGERRQVVDEFLITARARPGVPLLQAATARLRRGEVDAPMWMLRRTAELSGHPFDLANLALSQRHLGRLDAALATYERALELAPADDVLWNDYGLCLKAAGRVDDAIEAFERSCEVEAAPGLGPGTTNLAWLATRGRPDALPDLRGRLRELLDRRPEAEMARRMFVDAIVPRSR